jgi:hypothetical protein
MEVPSFQNLVTIDFLLREAGNYEAEMKHSTYDSAPIAAGLGVTI